MACTNTDNQMNGLNDTATVIIHELELDSHVLELDSQLTGSKNAPLKEKPVLINKNNRVPFANLFKNNRMAHINHKLEFVDTGEEELEFSEDVFDTVEKAFGICLLGFVVNGRPPTAALIDMVRKWGSNIHFQTHESGWITFTFPSKEVKEQVLQKGTHMVYGYHLFLKEMPRFFTFKEEDMK